MSAETRPQSAEETGTHTTAPPDDDLAALLSRLASLQGQAVPAFRFALVERSEEGVELSQLPRQQRALEMWRVRFPAGALRTLNASQIQRTEFPLLWVSGDGQDVRLVRGRLSHGAFSVEGVDRRTSELPAATVAQGHLLWMQHDDGEQTGETKRPGPQSAADWFAFALRKHRRIFFDAVFATFVISTVALAGSLYTMQVYDRVVPTKGFSTLWVLTIGVAMAMLIEFTLKQVRAHMVDRASKAIDLELSGVFFQHAMAIRMDARPRTVGTFAAQIRQFESVRNFLTTSSLFILADAPFALFFIGVIALIAGPIALVPLVMLPIAIASGFLSARRIEDLTADNMAESNRKSGLLIESVDGIESIKAAGGEWKLQERHRELTSVIAGSELQIKNLSTRATNLAQAIQQTTYIGLIASGTYAISNGSLTMGGLIACSIISGRALAPLAQVPQMLLQWKQAKVALKALDAIMAMPADREAGTRLVVPDRCDGELLLDKTAFAYPGDKAVLEIESLRFSPGERVAVIGAVGSGKSTLIKLLSGLYKPSAGTVFLDGIDTSQLAPEFVREHIGYLPQDVRLFNGTLRENLTLGLPTPNDSLILRAAAFTGLDAPIQAHPKGLELEISEGGKGLSGGQRQLVGLTRLLLAQPSVMLLDEPTASMDGALEARVMKHLFEQVDPASVLIVVTHKLAFLPLVKRIVVVDKGRIVLDGPRDQVLARLNGKPASSLQAAATQPTAPLTGLPA